MVGQNGRGSDMVLRFITLPLVIPHHFHKTKYPADKIQGTFGETLTNYFHISVRERYVLRRLGQMIT